MGTLILVTRDFAMFNKLFRCQDKYLKLNLVMIVNAYSHWSRLDQCKYAYAIPVGSLWKQ